jgi:hypothetical protein
MEMVCKIYVIEFRSVNARQWWICDGPFEHKATAQGRLQVFIDKCEDGTRYRVAKFKRAD